MFLLDTNILSALAPKREPPSGEAARLAAWLEAASDSLFLSVITAAEIESGIARAERRGARSKAEALAGWWATVEHLYSDRIIPLDQRVARVTGRLIDRADAKGVSPGFEDIAIAATAEVFGLVVLTRNARDFAPLGVPFANPYEALPEPTAR